MSKEGKQIKFRIDEALERRIDWIMYCERLRSQQDVMLAALAEWLTAHEVKWGPPVEPKARHLAAQPSRKRPA